MITEAKRAELDAVAAVRVIPKPALNPLVTLETLDARITALENSMKSKAEKETNG